MVFPTLIKVGTQFNYNDLNSLENILKNPNKIACVIMEPLTILEPACYGPKIAKIKNVITFVKKIFFRR